MSRFRAPAIAAGCAVLALAPATQARPIADAAQSKTLITINGSTSVYPLTQALAKEYVKKNKKVRFRVAQGGSDVGIADVARGRVNIGSSSRDLQSGDPGGLQFNKVARDGVCVVTHPSNSMANLSQEQVQDIFSGKTRRWDDVDGAKVTGPITLNVRTQASGTQDAFQNIFLGDELRVAPSASQKASNGLIQAAVRSDEQAIGYVDLRFTAGTYAVPYQGVACDLRNAKSGQYAGLRNFWYVTRGRPTGEAAKFISWAMRNRTAQQKIVAKNWVPVR